MSDQSQQPPPVAPPPEPPRQTLREVAEASWDEVQDEAADDTPDDDAQPLDGSGPARDARGRFAPADQAAKPGEQSEDPAPQIDPEASGVTKPVDPALGSNQPPQHWSEQDRQTFAKLPPEGQQFLLRRHTEMERDYSAKTQAAATAVQFTNSLAPIFTDPVIAGSIQQAGKSPYEAIGEWASFHKRAMDPNPQARMQLLGELAQRMGLNPAAIGQMSQPGPGALSEDDLKDPAIRYFADHIGKTLSEVATLRGQLDQMQRATAEAQQTEAMKFTRKGIDGFADEKDDKGNPKHPHFDAVLPTIIELYRANPERELQEAYDMAIWANPQIRSQLIAAERAGVTQQQANERARLAVRGNVRGITSPVSKPSGDGKAKGLRATLEASADETGF